MRYLQVIESMEKRKKESLEKISMLAFERDDCLSMRSAASLLKQGKEKDELMELIEENEKLVALVRIKADQNQRLADNGLKTVENAFKSIAGRIAPEMSYSWKGKTRKNVSRGSLIEGSL
jgi:hypothetical protein